MMSFRELPVVAIVEERQMPINAADGQGVAVAKSELAAHPAHMWRYGQMVSHEYRKMRPRKPWLFCIRICGPHNKIVRN